YHARSWSHAPDLAPVMERGVLVSDRANARHGEEGTRTIHASLEGNWFTVELTGLTHNQKHYLRAYAISEEGAALSGPVSIVPQDEATKQSRNLFAGATQLEGGWADTGWFGEIHPTSRGWIFHRELGWLYPATDGEDGLWVWEARHEWFWTEESVFPYLYRHRDATWLYFMGIHSGLRVFYNANTESLETQPTHGGAASGQSATGEQAETTSGDPDNAAAEANE
ncbi:uncharacterized protein METZ01_LOCUS364980, partial [marine metagenome]